MFGISGLVGTALGPFIAEVVINRAGFDLLFIVAAVTAGFGLIIQHPLKETYVHVLKPAESSFFLVLQKKRVFLIAAIALLFGFGLAAVNGFVSPYASERRIAFISLYYISYSSGAIFTRLLGGGFVDRQEEDQDHSLFAFTHGRGAAAAGVHERKQFAFSFGHYDRLRSRIALSRA